MTRESIAMTGNRPHPHAGFFITRPQSYQSHHPQLTILVTAMPQCPWWFPLCFPSVLPASLVCPCHSLCVCGGHALPPPFPPSFCGSSLCLRFHLDVPRFSSLHDHVHLFSFCMRIMNTYILANTQSKKLPSGVERGIRLRSVHKKREPLAGG